MFFDQQKHLFNQHQGVIIPFSVSLLHCVDLKAVGPCRPKHIDAARLHEGSDPVLLLLVRCMRLALSLCFS